MRSIRWIFLILVSFSLFFCARTQEPPPPQELLVVLNKSGHSATVIDLKSGQAISEYATGVAPHEAAHLPGTNRVVAANYGTRENPGSSLSIIDLSEDRVVQTIDLRRFRRPHGIEAFADGKRVAVTVEGNESVLVVDVQAESIDQVIPTLQDTSHMLVLSSDETRAYVANIGSGTISVLDLEKSRLVQNLRVGEGSEGMDLSPDGRELWVANRAEDSLAVLDTGTLEMLEKLPCPEFPIRVCFTHDGERVLVSNARSGDVAIFDSSSRDEVARIPMEITATEREDRLLDFDLSPVPIGIVVDAEDRFAYVANSNADIISVIDLESFSIVDRLVAGEEPDGMALVRVPVADLAK